MLIFFQWCFILQGCFSVLLTKDKCKLEAILQRETQSKIIMEEIVITFNFRFAPKSIRATGISVTSAFL